MLASTHMSTNPQFTPTIVYPHHSVSSSSNSDGSSFVPTFIVLGIIAGLTIMACLLGGVCAKRYLRPRQRRDHVPYDDYAAADHHHLHHMEAGSAINTTSNTIHLAAAAAAAAAATSVIMA